MHCSSVVKITSQSIITVQLMRWKILFLYLVALGLVLCKIKNKKTKKTKFIAT